MFCFLDLRCIEIIFLASNLEYDFDRTKNISNGNNNKRMLPSKLPQKSKKNHVSKFVSNARQIEAVQSCIRFLMCV